MGGGAREAVEDVGRSMDSMRKMKSKILNLLMTFRFERQAHFSFAELRLQQFFFEIEKKRLK